MIFLLLLLTEYDGDASQAATLVSEQLHELPEGFAGLRQLSTRLYSCFFF